MESHLCFLHLHAKHNTQVNKFAFSLSMNRNIIEFINEGILLSANLTNFSTVNIHFYYPTCANTSDPNISPSVEQSLVCDSHDMLMHNLTLTYNDNLSFRVSGTCI